MNKLDLIIAYILAFITIYFLQTLDYPSDWCLPVCVAYLLIYPITFQLMKKLPFSGKFETFRQNNEKILRKFPTTFVCSFFLFMSFMLSIGYNTDRGVYFLAIAKTPEKAGEIQTLLTKQHRSTGRRVIVDEKDGNVKYVITLSRYETDVKQFKEAVAELENSNIMDDSVEIPCKDCK